MKINGWLVLDKPEGISSTKALNAIKKITHKAKVGHAGTLDPFASGVLPVALGEATKTVSFSMNSIKEYKFKVKWGIATDTLDVEGKITNTSKHIPELTDIQNTLNEFIGIIDQTPPDFSAISINGKKAYKLARDGIKPDIKSRAVTSYELKLLSHNANPTDAESEFYLKCGKGFYVRALARDIAKKLNTCAHVTHLRRLSVGTFSEKNTISLDFIEDIVHNLNALDILKKHLKPVSAVLDDILVQQINSEEAQDLRHGKKIPLRIEANETDNVATMFEKELVAMCISEGLLLKPKRVFNF